MDANSQTRTVAIAVHGLGCGGGGALSVERAIQRLEGVTHVYVNPATRTAYVDFDPERCDSRSIAHAIERLGFSPGPSSESTTSSPGGRR